MADRTGISWCDATWNPIRGCSRVSEGCRNCYAERVATRFGGPGQPYAGLVDALGRWNGTVRSVPSALEQPLRWRKPRTIFVNSMSDLFHPALPFSEIDAVYRVMQRADRHRYIVLTKRPERAAEWYAQAGELGALPHVWFGVSVENQRAADERIPWLLQVPATVRLLSCEPLLGPIDLTQCAPYVLGGDKSNPGVMNAFNGLCFHPRTCMQPPELRGSPAGVHWVIAGGESGPHARPMHPEWARSLRDQCAAAGVPFHLKQWGEWAPISGAGLEYEHLYRSAVRARNGENQAEVDDVHGRVCTVPELILRTDGRHLRVEHPDAFRADRPGWPAMQAFRVGVRAAGRELDGRVWDEVPHV